MSKLGIVVEEADESLFWLDFARELALDVGHAFATVRKEADKLVAIFTAAYSTATRNQNQLKSLNH